jgi:lantibiotic leader peptide-processing serine protease
LSYHRTLLSLAALLLTATAHPQQPTDPVGALVPHRYLIVYRDNSIPTDVNARLATANPLAGARLIQIHPTAGVAVVQTSPDADDATTLAALRAQPAVAYVVHDRVISAHNLILRPDIGVVAPTPPAPPTSTPIVPPYDTYYTNTPQNWAVIQSGGYGAGVPGGPAHGPWDTTLGAGIRIAILDSGVDQYHPDIAPNIALNLSEIDQSPLTGLPSACDDGSPQDQQGHGTWTASLAAGAMGPGTGQIIGVAPSATILNIKVLERFPDPSSTATDLATQCQTGQATGLLSWVLQGIEDAVLQHASIISLSLGTLVDLDTGEGAGLQATFDRVTFAAAQAGAVVIASAGNDGVDLTNPRYIELPAQSRSVLAVVASTNPACAENLTATATCTPGPATLPYYSNFGAPLNAIAAPGGSYPASQLSTPDTTVSGWIQGACSTGIPNTQDGPPTDSAHSYGCFSLGHTQYVQAMGTSASAPLVAGAAALLRAANPTWTPLQVITALHTTATQTKSLPAASQLNLPAAFNTQLTTHN